MYHLRRFTIFLAFFFSLSFIAWFVPSYLNPSPPDKQKQIQDKRWVSSSPYWLDRQACRWLSLCGVHHLSWDPAALLPWNSNSTDDDRDELRLDEPERLELRSLSGWQDLNLDTKKRSARDDKAERRKIRRDIPDYVLEYAPLVHLFSGENFWPSDIAEHVKHMTPYLEEEALNRSTLLHDLHKLNAEDGRVYLTSDDDVESRPEWLHSHTGIPKAWEDDGTGDGDSPGSDPAGDSDYLDGTTWWDASRHHPINHYTDPRRQNGLNQHDKARPIYRRDQHPIAPPSEGDDADSSKPDGKPDEEGHSKSPAVLILVDKGNGIVDAFWFFFYSYNLGQTVFNIRFGNHVGDWEHCMMRFEHGIPRGIFFSEHEGGQAYTYHAVEKLGGRPVIYSAVGSHAMYAQPGLHPYVLPFKILKDVTDRGPLWDPAKNAYSYWYDYMRDIEEGLDLDIDGDDRIEALDTHKNANTASLVPTTENPNAPTSWFHYAGPWGDQVYSLADLRQWRLFAQYHYVTGPLGPKFKHLGRAKMCVKERCNILNSLKPGQTWYS
ncbi:vacuolar protein sorting-associated protein [Plectosphaerella plurivora]|uniref:Vacuolar protein sorting-associated protein n=1 Tax=Plectosphaerella plurivora TaxID=936078 RepID=A0A9P9AFH8_9PEZI|nr:vacuolar protein sorting-associated protein [Plectosphaerella plurivora]